MRRFTFIYFLVFSVTSSCAQEADRYVSFFLDTKAYDLAKAVKENDTNLINKLVIENDDLLKVTNPITGDNVLTLALHLNNYESFSRILRLGADPNFVNPFSKSSVLMEACNYNWSSGSAEIQYRYIELLLSLGADPKYAFDKNYTDEKGRSYTASSPIIEASRVDLNMVKLLIRYGANPLVNLDSNAVSPISAALLGMKYDIALYYIDSCDIDLTAPVMSVIQEPSKHRVSFYIQDLVVNTFTKAKILGNTKVIEVLKSENPEIEEANQVLWNFILELEKRGVDFKNHNYVK